MVHSSYELRTIRILVDNGYWNSVWYIAVEATYHTHTGGTMGSGTVYGTWQFKLRTIRIMVVKRVILITWHTH
eukprot:jgi/Botrbrau1/21686/Bobra.43_1s0082.1